MNIENNYYNLSEQETIKLSILLGTDGSEFQTKAWIQRGCLKVNDGSHKRFIKKLESYFEIVDFSGRGKERKYTLRNFKKEPSEIEDKRKNNGKQLSVEDVLIKNYVHQKLSKINSNKAIYKTYGEWAEYVEIIKLSNRVYQLFGSKLYELFNLFFNKEKIDNIKKSAFNYMNNRLINDIKLSIRHLSKEGLVEVSEASFGKYENETEIRRLNDAELQEIKSLEKTFVESKGVKYKNYIRDIIIKNEKTFELIDEVKQYLKEELGIEHYHQKVGIKINVIYEGERIRLSDVRDAFIIKLHRLSMNKSSKDKYKNAMNYGDKFQHLGVLVFIKMYKYENYNNEISKEVSKIKDFIQEVRFANYEREESERYESWEKYGFGEYMPSTFFEYEYI